MKRFLAAMLAIVGLLCVGCARADGAPGAAPMHTPVVAPTASSTTTATATAPTPAAPATTSTAPTTTTAEVAVTTTTTAEAVVRSGADLSPDQPVGDPVSISIPDIGVQSELIASDLLPDGTVAVPDDANIAGWFTGAPRPGERGPAVIIGHVDNRVTGPGVFFRLVELPIGAVVTVDTTAGPQHFVVRSVQQFPKAQFPTDLVYGAEPAATLRLITCGGSFDRTIRHYRDNIVAFLVRTDS